jgi:hypothetical protein
VPMGHARLARGLRTAVVDVDRERLPVPQAATLINRSTRVAKRISVRSQFPAPAATGPRDVEGSVWLMESLETGDFAMPHGLVRFTSTGRFDGVGHALDEPHYLMACLPLDSAHVHSAALGSLSTRSLGRLSSGRSSRTDRTWPIDFGQEGSVRNECGRDIRPGASGS